MLNASPDIFNHNLETVERLQKPSTSKQRSLDVLNHAREHGFKIKSGIMLGLGEQQDEIWTAIQDLASIGLNVLTLGQYLQPVQNMPPLTDGLLRKSLLTGKKKHLN